MRKLILFIQQHHQGIYNLFLFMVTAGVILYLFPRQVKFKYEFQKGKPWMHEDLVAPFDFPILKSAAEIEAEKDQLRNERNIFFQENSKVPMTSAEELSGIISEKAERLGLRPKQKERLSLTGDIILDKAYQLGVISWPEDLVIGDDNISYITRDGVSEVTFPQEFIRINNFSNWLNEEPLLADTNDRQFLKPLLVRVIEPNIVFDAERTGAAVRSQVENVLNTKGIVQQGEIVISRGNIVDGDNLNKLESLKVSYEGNFLDRANTYLVLAGQGVLVVSLMVILFLFLSNFRPHVLVNSSNLTLVLLNILLMAIASSVAVKIDPDYIYLVPLPILPIVLRAFFDSRLALFVHYTTALVIGFFAPNGFMFVFLQFVAGLYSILTITGLYKRSHLFTAAIKITAVYVIVYLGFTLVQEGQLNLDHAYVLGYFVGNGLLSLFAFPLIYIYEKIFGLVSDVTLLELSDTNSPLLRDLAQKAPGTFQHSLQVGNLAESACLEVGGNALLVRTAALYHDIGKIKNPLYFIENQTTGVNPHDELSFRESAQIIINHVKDGIKMAKNAKLPESIIDFIRTHHGTSTVQYFYKMHIKSFPDSEDVLEEFKYPGPKPFSKETAILMMCDAVEAASRSLKKPDSEAINQLVERLIDHQMEDGQFENADITLKEISTIKQVVKNKLRNIYHLRVEYPD